LSTDLEKNSDFHVTKNIFIDVDAEELNDVLRISEHIKKSIKVMRLMSFDLMKMMINMMIMRYKKMKKKKIILIKKNLN
jgi:hypothetical protein